MYIFNELPTAFPWYDKLDKQQRFRENARQACDYRLISPLDGLLPFQFKVDYTLANNIFDPDTVFIDDSYVVATDGTFNTLPLDPLLQARTGFIPVTPGMSIHFRTRETFNNRCAFYDPDYVFVSGVSDAPGTTGIVNVPAGAAFVVFNVSKTLATRDYDKFVFALTLDEPAPVMTPGNVTNWSIASCCGEIEIDLAPNIADRLGIKSFKDGIRVYYKGEALSVDSYGSVLKSLDLPPGTYYSKVEFSRGDTYYSEVFTVPDDRFKIGERSRYMRIDFWNDCDIEPIMYNDGEGGWKQYTYVDSYIHASEPEVEEDGERDGNDMLIPTFQRMVVRYRFSAVVPDFVKIALVSMQIHDNVFVTTENDTRSGRVERMSSSATVGDNGAYSTLDVVLEQYVLVKNSCCTDMDAFITE